MTQHRETVGERVRPPGKGSVCLISAILLACVAYVDYLTGTDISFSIFYLFPILLVTWYMGQMAGVVISVISGVLWYVIDSHFGQHKYSAPSAAYWNAIVRLGFFLIISVMLARLKDIMLILRARSEEVIKAYRHLDQTRKEQLLLRDRLLSHVSHELRTPLTALHQFITLVTDGVAGKTTPEQQEYLGIALRNVRQLDRMIADLLDTTRVETGKLRLDRSNLPVKPVVEEIVEPFRLAAADKSVTLSCYVSEGLAPVSADATRLRQVFLNLLDNAIKFTPPGGQIEVWVRERLEKPYFLHVSVSDTGPGISREAQEMLFQRLFQEKKDDEATARKGLGLGLFITKEIIKAHGGEIWVESEPGCGSTFHFTLPFFEEWKQNGAAKEEHET